MSTLPASSGCIEETPRRAVHGGVWSPDIPSTQINWLVSHPVPIDSHSLASNRRAHRRCPPAPRRLPSFPSPIRPAYITGDGESQNTAKAQILSLSRTLKPPPPIAAPVSLPSRPVSWRIDPLLSLISVFFLSSCSAPSCPVLRRGRASALAVPRLSLPT